MKLFFPLFLMSSVLFLGCEKNSEPLEQPPRKVPSRFEAKPGELPTPAIYKGTIPCADCDGINVTLDFENRHEITVTNEYTKGDNIEKESYKGSFRTYSDTLELNYDTKTHKYLMLSNEKFVQLNQDGTKPKGDLADNYILTKE